VAKKNVIGVKTNKYMTKKLLILLAFCILSLESFACMCGSAQRKYLLGQIGDTLYFFETDLYRSDYKNPRSDEPSEPQGYWYGDLYLRGYNSKNEKISESPVGSITINPQDSYIQKIQAKYKKTLDKLKLNKSFLQAIPKDISFCDFQTKCIQTKLYFDTMALKWGFESEAKRYEINQLKDSTHFMFDILFYKKYDFKALLHRFFINSIRTYQIGTKKLMLIHLATGSKESNGDGLIQITNAKEHQPECFGAFLNIDDAIFEEPTLMHGKGFDVIVY
jgi:hypothetical protein